MQQNAIRILHVDDELRFGELSKTILESEYDTFEVITETDPREVETVLEEYDVDCLVTDYDMPKMDGIELLAQVREQHSTLPVILFTGKGTEEVASRAISAGVTDYIQKEGGTDQYDVLANRIKNAVGKRRQEQRVAQLRHRFEVVLETMDTVVFLKEPSGRYLLMNDACRELLGVDPEQDVTELIDEDLFPPEQVEQYQADNQHVVETEEPFETEEVVPTTEGDQTRLTRKSPVYDQDGTVTAICGVSTDITEQKRRERSLEQYEEYLDYSPETMVIFNDHGEIEYQSAWPEYVPEFDLNQVQDKDGTDYIHPDDRDRVLTDFERARSGSDGPIITEFRVQTTDGEWVWFEAWTHNYLGEEPIDGILVSVRPITDRKETEQQLKTQRRFIQQALDSLHDLFYVLDTDGSLRQWNDTVSAVTGYTKSEIESMQPVEFFPTEEQEPIAEAIERTLTDGQARVEADILTADGQRIPHEFTGARLTDKNGNTTGMVGIGRDITDRKEREEELVQYKTYVEETSDTIAVVARNGTIKYHNTSGDSELSPFNVEGETGFEYVHPDDREDIIDLFTSVIEDGTEEVATELRVETADDEWRWIEARGVNKLDDSAIEGIVINSHDITERKEQEQELQRTRQHMELTLEETDSAVYESGPEPNQLRTYPSPNPVFGDDLTSTEEFLSYIHPEDKPAVEKNALDLALGDSYDIEYRVQTKDSLKWVHDYGKRIRAQETTEPLDIGIVTDITEQKQQENQLRQYNETLEQLYKTTETLLGSTDVDEAGNRIIEALETVFEFDIAGFWVSTPRRDVLEPVALSERGHELISDPPTYTAETQSLSWTAYQDQELRYIRDVSAHEERLNLETSIESEVIVPLGRYGLINIVATTKDAFTDLEIDLIELWAGILTVVLSQITQLDLLQEREMELRRERDRLDEFAGVVSHDLRNPLNVAMTRTELAAHECDSDHLADVTQALSRMDNLLDDVLRLARQGETVGEREELTLQTVVPECWRNVETGETTIDIDDQATLEADRSRFTEALENLFRNASQHGGESVTISVGVLENKAGFYVADDGPGIPKSDRKDVFDSGFTKSEDGTGFGLTIVNQIYEAHGWDITVTESTAGGARFEITGIDSMDC